MKRQRNEDEYFAELTDEHYNKQRNAVNDILCKKLNKKNIFSHDLINNLDIFIQRDPPNENVSKNKAIACKFQYIEKALHAAIILLIERVEVLLCETTKWKSWLLSFYYETDADADDEEITCDRTKRKRQKKAATRQTIVTRTTLINAKLETQIEIDPMTQQLQTAFDVSNVETLLLNKLHQNSRGLLLIDSMDKLDFSDDSLIETTASSCHLIEEFNNLVCGSAFQFNPLAPIADLDDCLNNDHDEEITTLSLQKLIGDANHFFSKDVVEVTVKLKEQTEEKPSARKRRCPFRQNDYHFPDDDHFERTGTCTKLYIPASRLCQKKMKENFLKKSIPNEYGYLPKELRAAFTKEGAHFVHPLQLPPAVSSPMLDVQECILEDECNYNNSDPLADLAGEQRLTSDSNIECARVAKPFDARELKHTMRTILYSAEVQKDQNLHPITFSQVYRQYTDKAESIWPFLTAFNIMLHLANEEELYLEQMVDFSDFSISQVWPT